MMSHFCQHFQQGLKGLLTGNVMDPEGVRRRVFTPAEYSIGPTAEL